MEKAIRRLEASDKRWSLLLICAWLFLCVGQVAAADRTFTVKSHSAAKGRVRYKIGSGSWSAWSDSHSVTAADGAQITLDAQSKNSDGDETYYGFSYWSFNIDNPPIGGTNASQYSFTVNSSYAGKTVTGYFTAWAGNLKPGATYKLSIVSSNRFKVTCGSDANYNNKEYDCIGQLNVNFDDPTKQAIIEFNTSALIWVYGRIKVQKGYLTMRLGDGFTGSL